MQNISTRSIRVDIRDRKNYNKITVHQGESGIVYHVSVYQNAELLYLNSIANLSVKIKVGNRDVSVTEDCTVDNSSGLAYFTITKAMTATSGNLECRLDLIVGNDTVATATFIMYVVPDPTQTAITANQNIIASLTSGKVDYYIAGSGDLNSFKLQSTHTDIAFYKLGGGYAHLPDGVSGPVYGYLTAAKQSSSTNVWIEQTLYVNDKIYHRRYTEYNSSGSWSEWVRLATSADISNLQQQINNIQPGSQLPNADEMGF